MVTKLMVTFATISLTWFDMGRKIPCSRKVDRAVSKAAQLAVDKAALAYMPGFGNDFETESLPGALPQGQNSPQKLNYGLYAEQLSGSPFTAPRGTNERSWLYRIRPSVRHTRPVQEDRLSATGRRRRIVADHSLALGQLRWGPLPAPAEELNFLAGIRTMTTAGDAMTQAGMAAHVYAFNADMVGRLFLQCRRRDC